MAVSHVVIHLHEIFIYDLHSYGIASSRSYNKQVYVLLMLVEWALKQLEGNGATDYGNPLSIG